MISFRESLQTVDLISADDHRRILHVVLRHIGKQLTDQLDAFLLGFDGELSYARLGRMHRGTAQLLLRHVFARHGLHDLRTGEEHIREPFFMMMKSVSAGE